MSRDHRERLVAALRAVVTGHQARAEALVAESAAEGSILAGAMQRHLVSRRRSVYDAPAAFRAFIAGGGNVGLYERLSAALAEAYRATTPFESLLDVGVGDGHALIPALFDALEPSGRVGRVEVVESSAELVAACRRELQRLVDRGLVGEVVVHAEPVRTFLARRDGHGDDRPGGVPGSWSLTQSTFALHALDPVERTPVLDALAARSRRLLVAEFDVPDLVAGSDEHLRYLVDHYETGLAEYDEDRDLVAGGFLVPVLLGQIDSGRPRATWEQAAAAWRRQLLDAGFGSVTITSLGDHWWAPAVLLDARA